MRLNKYETHYGRREYKKYKIITGISTLLLILTCFSNRANASCLDFYKNAGSRYLDEQSLLEEIQKFSNKNINEIAQELSNSSAKTKYPKLFNFIQKYAKEATTHNNYLNQIKTKPVSLYHPTEVLMKLIIHDRNRDFCQEGTSPLKIKEIITSYFIDPPEPHQKVVAQAFHEYAKANGFFCPGLANRTMTSPGISEENLKEILHELNEKNEQERSVVFLVNNEPLTIQRKFIMGSALERMINHDQFKKVDRDPETGAVRLNENTIDSFSPEALKTIIQTLQQGKRVTVPDVSDILENHPNFPYRAVPFPSQTVILGEKVEPLIHTLEFLGMDTPQFTKMRGLTKARVAIANAHFMAKRGASYEEGLILHSLTWEQQYSEFLDYKYVNPESLKAVFRDSVVLGSAAEPILRKLVQGARSRLQDNLVGARKERVEMWRTIDQLGKDLLHVNENGPIISVDVANQNFMDVYRSALHGSSISSLLYKLEHTNQRWRFAYENTITPEELDKAFNDNTISHYGKTSAERVLSSLYQEAKDYIKSGGLEKEHPDRKESTTKMFDKIEELGKKYLDEEPISANRKRSIDEEPISANQKRHIDEEPVSGIH